MFYQIEKAFPSFVLDFDRRYLTFVCPGVALDWIATAMEWGWSKGIEKAAYCKVPESKKTKCKLICVNGW